ncbi:hypothetical protein Cgig2_017388 [Carnegiea gigantea]|uniref:Uncharacterized protein n=1 Tax=Carnegiea gigantea TaxID=171969 RepID=A0A9Q1GRJ1_9CARY|nr:hypothetical protein Cgig2_017388 [Carnegiea gigantea]
MKESGGVTKQRTEKTERQGSDFWVLGVGQQRGKKKKKKGGSRASRVRSKWNEEGWGKHGTGSACEHLGFWAVAYASGREQKAEEKGEQSMPARGGGGSLGLCGKWGRLGHERRLGGNESGACEKTGLRREKWSQSIRSTGLKVFEAGVYKNSNRHGRSYESLVGGAKTMDAGSNC